MAATTHNAVRLTVEQRISTRPARAYRAPVAPARLSSTFSIAATRVDFKHAQRSCSSRTPASFVCSATAEDTTEAAPEPPADTVEGGRHYEICYLISSDHSADEAQDLLVKYKDFVLEKGGVIHRLEDWGCRKLAYPIKKSNEAYYVLMNYEMKPADAKEMSDEMSKDLEILRFMVLTRDYAITGPSPMLGGTGL